MKIRAVTLGIDLPLSEPAGAFADAARFLNTAREAFVDLGVEVQTTRLSGSDLGRVLEQLGAEGVRSWAERLEQAVLGAGIEFFSFGRVPARAHEFVATHLGPMLASGRGFASADLVDGVLPSVPMAAACARAVRVLAEATADGFGNLRFAATASCPPNIPFLPAAYHVGGRPRFSIAVEAADVVVQAAQSTGPLGALEDRLVGALEAACAPVEQAAVEVERDTGVPFVGIDLSPAPFPSTEVSIGGAFEAVGVDRFGAPGTLFVAATITRAIRRTRVARSGFSGLMLPILEDAVLARRAAEVPSTLHELLLYSAVCGTGLDTVPLPGDISEAELAGIYLDVAALSVALNGKPLTARLLPVPGARAGDVTTYAFEYFANSRVLPSIGSGASGLVARDR